MLEFKKVSIFYLLELIYPFIIFEFLVKFQLCTNNFYLLSLFIFFTPIWNSTTTTTLSFKTLSLTLLTKNHMTPLKKFGIIKKKILNLIIMIMGKMNSDRKRLTPFYKSTKSNNSQSRSLNSNPILSSKQQSTDTSQSRTLPSMIMKGRTLSNPHIVLMKAVLCTDTRLEMVTFFIYFFKIFS